MRRLEGTSPPGPNELLVRPHPHQDEFLGGREKAYLVLGCGSQDRVLAIPHARLREWLDDLWTTERDDGRRYWHIRLQRDGEKLWLDRRQGKGRQAMSEFLVQSGV